jgi:transcriptional regulator with XRE-family HTH domain
MDGMEEPRTDAQELARQIGVRLRYVREALQLTTTELGADVGLDEAAIRHIEKGRRGPSVPLIATLCHLLRITPQYLFYGDVRDIDPELREALLQAHPELRWPSLPQPAGKRSSSRRGSARSPTTRPRMVLT